MKMPEDFDPVHGEVVSLGPMLRRIVAPNPSPMTWRGTNTYLVGASHVAVIDPGPDNDAHLQAILAATDGGHSISHILVTHAHLDHSPLARQLSKLTRAPVLAFGPAEAGRSAVMTRLAASGLAGGGEGIDTGFQPDTRLTHGATVDGDGWTLRALHTPGHIGNHICLAWDDVCFTGDHVMGWASSLVSPPDGDLTDFMISCATLQKEKWRIFYPGHGKPVTSPQERLKWLISHRQARESAILDALDAGPATAAHIARRIYTDVTAELLGAATRNVLAHLIDLHEKKVVRSVGDLSETASFLLREKAGG
ncbi:MBL fold metallo-hydrolase [Roseobacter sp. S98]|uniref:MBL fold metallo-hydrolase n=1 Tax=Roseobacter algicola (ex Choi et al. 2025) (nom. illeg.) TaxID=3092138 RepID=UPI003F51A87E